MSALEQTDAQRRAHISRRDGLKLAASVVSLAAPTFAWAQQEAAIGGALEQSSGQNAIRPFQVRFPDTALAELRERIDATVWPEREIVDDASQGVQLATAQALARY
jgi:hypothetical protein